MKTVTNFVSENTPATIIITLAVTGAVAMTAYESLSTGLIILSAGLGLGALTISEDSDTREAR